MDVLNFISWIKALKIANTLPNNTLIPVGIKDPNRGDSYLPAVITSQNLIAQVGANIPAGAQGPQGPQGVAGPVGPAGLNWQGAWSSLGTYVIDDAVGYAGASWFCIANVGPSATTPDIDPTNWALLASQGSPGQMGPQGIQGAQGVSGGLSSFSTCSFSTNTFSTPINDQVLLVTTIPANSFNFANRFCLQIKGMLEKQAGPSTFKLKMYITNNIPAVNQTYSAGGYLIGGTDTVSNGTTQLVTNFERDLWVQGGTVKSVNNTVNADGNSDSASLATNVDYNAGLFSSPLSLGGGFVWTTLNVYVALTVTTSGAAVINSKGLSVVRI
jgi:hypothetical protein